jgi:tetratricopeptide (TPR) repeat protein
MGEVYLARDLALDRDVAIKLLPTATSADLEARRRLLREAQSVAKLDHPNICQVFDVGETPDGRAFIAMSYVEGQTLAARIATGALPVREALALARDIAEALGAAHARGIVHRDLKPQNIIVTPSGRPKLLDFGVAKLLVSSALAPTAAMTTCATTPGAVVGTPAYMSPEQVEGHAVDGRSDLFSLGAVLFECLVGRRAFSGSNALPVAAAILHEHPPLVSTLRSGISPEVDELCARLLAKDPSARFQTADEVVGALRLLLPFTDRSGPPTPGVGPGMGTPQPAPARPNWTSRWASRWAVLATTLVVAALGIGAWRYQSWRPLPQPPPEAERWYRRGTDFIREGAYHSASVALDQAIRQFPEYTLAYARHAEALTELDDEQHASQQLLRMQAMLGDESRLPDADRLRVQGIRALVLRDLPRAVEAFRALVARTSDDAGAWVDLGRAQESAEQRAEARVSYERALSLDAGLAAAHVRKASIDSQAGLREPAMEGFAEAERLYRAASNAEGETEVLLRRGAFLDARGEYAPARRDLDRAWRLASDSGATAQSIRARLAIGSMTVTEGKYALAETLIGEATDDARKGEMWSLVADGLIEAGSVLVNQPARRGEADAQLQEAVRLATQHGAQRTAARGTLQRASNALRDEPALARDLASGTLESLRVRGYLRLELTARSIVGRAYLNLDDPATAHATASDVLRVAQQRGDDAQAAVAFTGLAGAAAAQGDLPAALEARTQAETLNRKIGNEGGLPFSLVNRAELLILLGRASEAEPLLAAVDQGIARGLDAYKGRAPRVGYLRALSAVVQGRTSEAARHARAVLDSAAPSTSAAVLAGALLRYALPAGGAPGGARVVEAGVAPPGQPDLARELHYWSALEAHARRDDRRALALATEGLALNERIGNDELAWRMAAVACLAARLLGEHEVAGRMKAAVTASRTRLKERWQAAVAPYDARADLTALRRKLDRTGSTDAQGRD